MNDDWRNQDHRWKDLKRVELGRKDIHEEDVYARAYFKQSYEWQWVPCLIHGNHSLQWGDYFTGKTLPIPGGTLYPRTNREDGEDNLMDVISGVGNIEETIAELAKNTDGTKDQARASLLLNAFNAPVHEVRKRMGIADPLEVHHLAQEFETLFVNTEQFNSIECDRGDIVELDKHC